MTYPIQRYSLTGQTAYVELLRFLQDNRISEIRGTPSLITVGRKKYWYDRYRAGNEVIKRYIGKDKPELRKKLAQITTTITNKKDRQKEQARLIRILRAEGYLSTDAQTGQLLSAFANAGMFRLGGTLIGTHAFSHYGAELGIKIPFDHLTATEDYDFASFHKLALTLEDAANPKTADTLADFSFEPVPSLEGSAIWKWKQSTKGTLVEFLTPSFNEDEGIRPLPTIGVHARALHFLNYLIADPVPAAVLYRYGALTQIPRPERYAIHKLIVADRRREGPDAARSRKDRAQSEFLINVLAEDRPGDLLHAWEDARSRGAKWCQRLDSTLERLPDSKAVLNAL
ncbi:MAG: hypothetical protein GY952_05990 [Rhodobacteraceae bacterium]|nr:hypothetical protein [Paracoccaceae bacterium]